MPTHTPRGRWRGFALFVATLLPHWLRRRGPLAEVAPVDADDPHVKSWSAWSLTVLVTGIGIWLSLRPGELRAGLAGFAHGVARVVRGNRLLPVHLEVAAFVVVTLVWGAVLKARLTADTLDELGQREQMRGWITNAPSNDVLASYPAKRFHVLRRQLGEPPTLGLDHSQAAEHVARKIRNGLAQFTGLAQDFARAYDATYGASIMLVANREEFNEYLIGRLIFHDPAATPGLRAMLVLADELLLTQADDALDKRYVKSIALPVPQGVVDENAGTDVHGSLIALPGAPNALLSGNPNVFEDARTMVRACGDFSRPIRTEIETYFSNSGAGRDVRSFASFRLSTDRDSPIGVLNIDSNRTHIFGREPAHYSTIYALLAPMVELMCTQVREYVRLRGAALFDVPPS